MENKVRIKKHKNKNEYLLTEQNFWVRNFTKNSVPYVDINKTIQEKDHFLFLKNEYNNSRAKYPWIDSSNVHHKKIVIISDGLNFESKHKILETLSPDVTIIGVNNTLAKWSNKRNMNYYVVNNPYRQCLNYLTGSKNHPKCIASNRTNYEFLQAYKGIKNRYYPVNEESYNSMDYREIRYQIDDNRNVVCAALCLAYKFGAEKIVLFCCDDAFEDKREGAECFNKVWFYPHDRIPHNLIDNYCYWIKKTEKTRVLNCSSGLEYNNAQYITEDKMKEFFDGDL